MSLRERPVPWCLTHDSAGGGIPEVGCFAASTGHGYPADCVERDFVLRPVDALVIEKDADGEWPGWAYEVAGRRLEFVGGTDQWKHASYRMAYLSLVFRALESHQGGTE